MKPKWESNREHLELVNLMRSARPAKIPPRSQWRFLQEVTDDPRRTSKDLQVSVAWVMVSVHDSTISKRLGKDGIHVMVAR